MPTKLQKQIAGQFGSQVPKDAIILDPLDNGQGEYWLNPEAVKRAKADAFLEKKRAAKKFEFNPNEPRDERGRWTDAGGSSMEKPPEFRTEGSNAGPGFTPQALAERDRVIKLVDGVARNWLNNRTAGAAPTRGDLADMMQFVGDKYGAQIDSIVKDFADKSKYPNRPTIHLVVGEKNVPDVWLLGWRETDKGLEATPIHDHGPSEAGVYVHKGAVQETIFAIDKKEFGQDRLPFHSVDRELRQGSAITIAAPYLHDISAAPGNKNSVTIHAYYPPLNDMGFYEVQGNTLVKTGSWKENPNVMKAKGFRDHRFPCFHYHLSKYYDSTGVHSYEWDESQHPRHPSGSAEGGQFAPSEGDGTVTALGVPAEQLEKIVDEVALNLGTPSGVDTRYGGTGHTFKVGGEMFEAAGEYNPNTNQITIFNGAFEKRPSLPQQNPTDPYYLPRGIMAHELQHAKFEQWRQQASRERKMIDAMPEAEQAKYRVPWDPNNMENYMDLTAEGREKFKALAVYQELDRYWIDGQLQKEDGVSPYSKAYWAGYDKDEVGYMRATDETLAEIARIKATVANEADAMISKMWTDLYDKIKSFTH